MSYQQSIIDSLKIVNKQQQSTAIETTTFMQTKETFSFDFSNLIKSFYESEKFYDFSTFIFECLLLILNGFFVFMSVFILHRCGFLKKKTWSVLNFFFKNFEIKQECHDNECGNNYLRFVDHSTGKFYFNFST
jgi:hypothetical protein